MIVTHFILPAKKSQIDSVRVIRFSSSQIRISADECTKSVTHTRSEIAALIFFVRILQGPFLPPTGPHYRTRIQAAMHSTLLQYIKIDLIFLMFFCDANKYVCVHRYIHFQKIIRETVIFKTHTTFSPLVFFRVSRLPECLFLVFFCNWLFFSITFFFGLAGIFRIFRLGKKFRNLNVFALVNVSALAILALHSLFCSTKQWEWPEMGGSFPPPPSQQFYKPILPSFTCGILSKSPSLQLQKSPHLWACEKGQ